MAASLTHASPTYTDIALPAAKPAAVNVTLPIGALAATLALSVATQVLEINPSSSANFVQAIGSIDLIPDAVQLGAQRTFKAWSTGGAVSAVLTVWS